MRGTKRSEINPPNGTCRVGRANLSETWLQRGFEMLAQHVSEDLPKGLRPHSKMLPNKPRPSPLFFFFFFIKTYCPIQSYRSSQ